jgi:hypothetical protein
VELAGWADFRPAPSITTARAEKANSIEKGAGCYANLLWVARRDGESCWRRFDVIVSINDPALSRTP